MRLYFVKDIIYNKMNNNNVIVFSKANKNEDSETSSVLPD